jgi:hypothetical protein
VGGAFSCAAGSSAGAHNNNNANSFERMGNQLNPRRAAALDQGCFRKPLSAIHSSSRAAHAPTGRRFEARNPNPCPPLE